MMNTINNFVPGSLFEQDHLLTLIILRLYVKEWPKCARISKQTDVAQNLIDDFFFLTLSEDHSIGRILIEKKIWGYGSTSWENGSFVWELNERAEAATSSYSAAVDFLQYIYSVLVVKNH